MAVCLRTKQQVVKRTTAHHDPFSFQAQASTPVIWVPLSSTATVQMAFGIAQVPNVHVAFHKLAQLMTVAVVDFRLR